MDELELPTGETVTPSDVFCYENYPYRFLPAAERDGTVARAEGPGPDPGEVAFYLVPLYWGGGEMDVPMRDRSALVEQWDASRGVLSEQEWREWLADARTDERFDAAELDAIARELGIDGASAGDDGNTGEPARGLVARIRGLFG